MFDVFLTPAYTPFSIAFVVMIGIGLIEAIGLGLGEFNLHAGVDPHAGSVLDWLGIGSSHVGRANGRYDMIGAPGEQSGTWGWPTFSSVAGDHRISGGNATVWFSAG